MNKTHLFLIGLIGFFAFFLTRGIAGDASALSESDKAFYGCLMLMELFIGLGGFMTLGIVAFNQYVDRKLTRMGM